MKKVIGSYLILSGLTGVLAVLVTLANSVFNTDQLISGIIFLGAFCLLSFCGYQLLSDSENQTLIEVLLILQVLQFSALSFSFAFVAGTTLIIDLSTGFVIAFDPWIAEFDLSFIHKDFLRINFMPLVVIFLLRTQTET